MEPDDFVSLTMFEDLYAVAKENLLDFVKADFYRFARNENSGNMSLTYNHLDKNGEYYNQLIKSQRDAVCDQVYLKYVERHLCQRFY